MEQLRYLVHWAENRQKKEFKLIDRVSVKWKEIGYQIDLTPKELDKIYQESRRSVAECCEVVMGKWLNGQGAQYYPVSWEGMFQLLRDIACFEVAVQLDEAATKAGKIYVLLASSHFSIQCNSA